MKNLQYFVYLFIISLCFLHSYCSARISDKRLCADPKCSVAVSLARSVIRYQSDDDRILSFAPGETVTIYSKSAGSKTDLWGAQIGKKRGYVPKNLIQEYRILKKELKYTVTTDEDSAKPVQPVQDKLEPPAAADIDKAPYYDVVDGTTLYIPEDSTMQMTTNGGKPKPVAASSDSQEKALADTTTSAEDQAPQEIPDNIVAASSDSQEKALADTTTSAVGESADKTTSAVGESADTTTNAVGESADTTTNAVGEDQEIPNKVIAASSDSQEEVVVTSLEDSTSNTQKKALDDSTTNVVKDQASQEIPVTQVHSEVLTKNKQQVQSESAEEERGGLISPSDTPSYRYSAAPAEIPVSDVPPAEIPVSNVPPADIPASDVPPADIPASDVPPADIPASDVPPADIPASDVPPADIPASDVAPAEIPVSDVPQIPASDVAPAEIPDVPSAEIPVSDVPPAEMPIMSIPSKVLTKNKESSGAPAEVNGAAPAVGLSESDHEAPSVYDYFADTLTGWMSGDGGSAEEEEQEEDEEEEEDTGGEVELLAQSISSPVEQQVDETTTNYGVTQSTEVHGQEYGNHSVPLEELKQQPDVPPTTNTQDSLSNIDISKINYLSSTPNIVPPADVPLSDQPPADLPLSDEPPADVPLNDEPPKVGQQDLQEKIPIPDSDFADKMRDTVPASYYTSSENQSPETPEPEKTEDTPVTPSSVEEMSPPFTYSWDLPSTKVEEESTPSPTFHEPSQEQPVETTATAESTGTFEEVTTASPSESAASSGMTEETTHPSGTEENTGTLEEITTPSVQSAESTGTFEEINTPSSAENTGTFEEITTPSPAENTGTFEQITTPSPAENTGTFEQITTPSPAENTGTFEQITTPSSAESAGTFEEITTAAPSVQPAEEPVQEDGESGAIFASWVYTLFGYGESESSTTDSSIEEETTTSSAPLTETSTSETTPATYTEELPSQAAAESSWWPWASSSDHTEQPHLDSQQTCSSELGVDCGSVPSLPQEQIVPTSSPHHQQQLWTAETVKMDLESVLTSGTFIYLVVTAITVLIFTLGYYYIETMKKDGTHVAIINSLQKQLLVASKEKLILQDELESTKDQVSQVQTSSSFSCEEVEQLKEKLEESERVRSEAEDQVVGLEKELEAATEAGLELNKMLSEFLSAQKGSEDLSMGVELLQQQLNKQQTTISTMNHTLNEKTLEIESLQNDLTTSQAQLQVLQEEREKTLQLLQEVQQQKQKLKEDLEESCVTLANQLQEAATQRETEVSVLRDQLKASELRLSEVEDSLRARSSEVEVLENSLSQLKQLADDGETDGGHKKLDALINVGKAQAELKLVTSERDVLKERLQGEEDARQLLEDHVTVIREQVEKLKERHELAEKEKLEAQTKLEVLSSYFKEKETQLQKELGLQEAMSEQKKEHVSSTHARIKSLEEEIDSLKTQNETLKQEIVDQERSLKSQLTTLEKKAHENWIAARQAERKLDDSKQEAGTLRNRLTLLEKGTQAQNGEEGKTAAQRTLDSNGEPTSPPLHIGDSPSMSPPHHPQHYMMMPPPPPGPPGQFMPPPPPPEYMHSPPPPLPLYPDRRPPPLGRMSSPPPHPFSPPPPDRYSSPYRPRSPASDRSLPRYRYSSRSPSPPPYDYGHYPSSAPRPWDEPPPPRQSGFRPLNRDKDTKDSK